MSRWSKLRLPLLVFIFANVLFVFGRSILDPTIGKRTVTPFVFPKVVSLPQWRLVTSHPLKDQTVERPPLGKLILPGRQYRYIQNDLHASFGSQSGEDLKASRGEKDSSPELALRPRTGVEAPHPKAPLNIEMRYEVETDGDVKQFIKNNTAIQFLLDQPLLVVRQQEGVGFYGVFVYQKRAYLDACINSRGGSTFTKEQFSYNRIQYDVQLNRLLPWLLGLQPLRDKRCLWTHLSIPLNQSSPEQAYLILENAWFSWYKWWSSRFPKP